ncbi:MAG: HupE/UreJ family protein [Gammaproteobacteria bacterium]|nr:HupE/UreJ family protein [Gammaproteobacteria bacterium]
MNIVPRPLSRQLTGALLMFALSVPAFAHKSSDSYLRIDAQQARITGTWDIALRDLDFALTLDADGDGALTWDEVRVARARIFDYAFARLQLKSDISTCPIDANDVLIDNHSDGAYAVLRFNADCAHTIDTLGIDYRLLFELDMQHRGLLRLTANGASQSAVFGPATRAQKFSLATGAAVSGFDSYVRLGIEHILTGIDHLLFLFVLLLPAVLSRANGAWRSVELLSPVLIGITKVVTAFTLAHSLTLALAVFGIVQLPPVLVESAIALSIIAAALNNLWPLFAEKRWMLAFGFGLMHGFGFSGALTDLGLAREQLASALLGFNLGVELAQLAFVALVVPTVFALRRRLPYVRAVLAPGSALIALMGVVWLLERSFDIKLLPL